MPFVAPLRCAVLHLGAQARPWRAEAMADLGAASIRQARAYASMLARAQVVVVEPDGRIRRGRAFASWRARTPKTRPGGHRSVKYKAIPKASE